MADDRLQIKIERDGTITVTSKTSPLTPGLEFHRSRYQAWKKSFDELLRKHHRLPRAAGPNDSVPTQKLGSLDVPKKAVDSAAFQRSAKRVAEQQENILQVPPNTSDAASKPPQRQESININEVSSVCDSPVKSNSTNPEESPLGALHINNRVIRSSHSRNGQTKTVVSTPVEILGELMRNIRRVYAPFFENSIRVCHDDEDLEKKFPIVRDGILKTMIDKYGERVTKNMISLYQSFAEVIYQKAEAVNKITRRKNKILEELIHERSSEIQEKIVKLNSLTNCLDDIKELYENDDPLRVAMLKAVGEKYATEYVKVTNNSLEEIHKLVGQMKKYEQLILGYIEDDICCREVDFVTYHQKAEAATGLVSNPGKQAAMLEVKMEETFENIRLSLKQKNEARTEGEFKIARQAIQYAGTKYCELLESQPKNPVTSCELKELHKITASSILKCFYGIPEFVYSYPWKTKKPELVESLEKEFAEITKRDEAKMKLKEAALESAIEERITTVRRAVMQLLSEDMDERDLNRELESLLSQSVTTFKSKFPAANSAAVSKLKSRLNTCIDSLTRRHSPLSRSTRFPEETSRRKRDKSSSDPHRKRTENPIKNQGETSRIRNSSNDARTTFSENLSEIATPILDDSSVAFVNTLKRSHEGATSYFQQETKWVSKGVGIFFTPNNVYISVKFGDVVETFAIPPFICFETLERTTVLVEYSINNHGAPQHTCIEVYPMVSKTDRGKTREQLTFWHNGESKKRLWAEEILAFHFIQIQTIILQRWDTDICRDSIAIGLPSYVSSLCKLRVRRALEFAGLKNNCFVQLATAISLFRLKSSEEMVEHYELALYIQDNVLEISLNKFLGRKLTVCHSSSRTDFVGLKTPRHELISRRIRDGIEAVLRKARICTNQVKFCTSIIDQAETSADFQAIIHEIIANALPDQALSSVLVGSVPDSIMDGLLLASQHHHTRTSPSDLYQEVFPYTIEIHGVEDAAERKMRIISAGDKAKDLSLKLWTCRLGTSKSPTRIISHFSHGSNNEVKFHIPDELMQVAPHAEVKISVNQEAIVSVKLENSVSQYKLVEAVYSLPKEDIPLVKSRIQAILTASSSISHFRSRVPNSLDPSPVKRSKTL